MRRIHANAIVDSLALVAALFLTSTGFLIRWVLPPGSGRVWGEGMGRMSQQRPVALLWGFTRHQWGEIHYWIAVSLIVLLSFHVVFHWKWIVSVVSGSKKETSGWRLLVGILALVMLALIAATPFWAAVETVPRWQLQ